MDWRLRGACRFEDPDLFFLDEELDGYSELVQTERAKSICYFCPVTFDCLDWALENEEPVGIWGGMTEAERRSLLRRRRKRASGRT